MNKVRVAIAFVALFAIGGVVIFITTRQVPPPVRSSLPVVQTSTATTSETNGEQSKPSDTTIAVSPNKDLSLIISSNRSEKVLYIARSVNNQLVRIYALGSDEGITSVVWNPDETLVAFVNYNLLGHSPMTTSHVWVVRSDGTGLREILLSEPYKQFSTLDPRWVSNDILDVTSVSLQSAGGVHYSYDYQTNTIKESR